MEGLRDGSNVKNYDVLAGYYDELLSDEESLSLWLKYIEEEPFHTCLELASGSGVMAGILKKKETDILASDISEAMKEAAKSNYDGEYLILNMISYQLNKTFDLVLCICDSFNYLEKEEFDSFFQSAYSHLNKGGRLIFDMHSLKRLDEFEDLYIEEGELSDCQYQWTILADKEDRNISEHFTFYTNDGMIQEHHLQNVFDISDVKESMERNGFQVRVIEDFVEEEKVLMIGTKL